MGWKGGALQAAEKRINVVILSSSEGSAFEFSSNYRFFVACWLLRMTARTSFSAACLAPRDYEPCSNPGNSVVAFAE